MYLKNLELYGFKSFAKRTKIAFPPHIAAVVGPNGSGKSNISDAILWALGETSIKLLRGSKMEDIIFGGTADSASLSFAEVILYFDNSDKYFSLPYEEISVSRKLYRSGESEFRINNQKVRLKDIHELFLDTGVGRDGYSLISQGQIDRILSNRPEERRSIFEEAIGISRYKLRKDTSAKSLKDTEENITRIDDILSEIEVQEEQLKAESEIAMKYRNMQRNREQLYGKLLYVLKSEYSNDRSEILEKRKSIKKELLQVKKRQEELQNKMRGLEQKETEIEQLIENNREENIENIKTTESIKGKIEQFSILLSHNESIFTESLEKIRLNHSEITKIKSNIEKEEKALHNMIESRSEILQKKKQVSVEIKKMEQELKEIEQSQSENESILKNHMSQKSELEGKINSGDYILREQKARLESLKSHLVDIKSLGVEMIEEKKRREDEIRDSKEQIADLTDERKQLVSDRDNLLQKIEDKNKLIQSIETKLYKKNQDLIFLKRVYENNEGYYDSVRNFLSYMKRTKKFNREIIGPVADHISIDKEYELAIGTALGNNAQNIMIYSEKNLVEITSIVKKNQMGRITFYPVKSMKERKIDEDLARLTNVNYSEALDYVHFDTILYPVLSNLLGRILVVDSVEEARRLSSDLNRRYRIVTRDGEIFQIGGSVTVGKSKQFSKNLYNREEKIVTLEKEIQELEIEQQSVFTLLEELKRESENKRIDIEDKNIKLTELNEKYNRTLVIMENIENSIQKNIQTQVSYREKIENESNSILETENKIAAYQASLEQFENLMEQMDSTTHREILSALDEKRVIENNLRLKFNTLEIEIKSIQNNISSFVDSLAQNKSQISDLEKKTEDLKIDIQNNKRKLSELRNLREQTDNKLKSIVCRFEELSKEKRENEIQIVQLNNLKDSMIEETLSLNRQEEKWENKWIQFQESQQELLSSLDEWEDKHPNFSLLVDNEDSKRSLEIQLKSLDREMTTIGFVNMNSIEQFEEISARINFLREQKEDLEEAKQQLEKVIVKLEKEMKSLFQNGLIEIQKNFKEIFGILFQGGKAELKLVDEANALTSGIEIIVQPPGKKAQSLSLLSGGERAMTAVALLFALLKMKRPPFVILDEIDATLDEANINRYTSYLKNLEDIQFLMITHRKPTMEIADRIYGVTMEKDGISKIYTMKLEGDEDHARVDEK